MQVDPKPQSPCSLLRHHSELLVNPLLWTSRHLDLVGCQFKDIGVMGEDSARQPPRKRRRLQAFKEYRKPSDAEILAQSVHPSTKLYSLVDIVNYEDSPFKRPLYV
jgi:hypothetical protein